MKSAFDDDEEYELTAFGQHFHYAMTDVPPKIEFKNPPAGAAQQGDGIMSAATHMLSVSDWLTLPEVATPTLRDEGETGAIVMVAKVGFLLATDADCKKANITADHGLNGKRVLPTATIQNSDHASLHRLPTDLAPWVMDAVALAHAGRNQFPSKVEFGRLNERVYVQFDLTNERSH